MSLNALIKIQIVALLCLLSGCGRVLQDMSLDLSWQQRQQQLSSLINWQFRGNFILKIEQQKFSANIFWRQHADHYDIRFFGPLGLGGAQLLGEPNKVVLKDSRGKEYSAENPELLLQQQLDWSLPLSSLYYWLRGLPAPGEIEQVSYDAFHRIQHLEQQGWSINYIAYQRVQMMDLPEEMSLTQDKFYLSLAIERDSWLASR